MLEPFMIEKIKQQEDAKKRAESKLRLELPVYKEPPEEEGEVDHADDPGRGVIIIDSGCTD